MSNAPIHASVIKNDGPRALTVWRHLLWKDFRQVYQLIIGIIVIAASLQLLLGMLERLLPDDFRQFSHGVINVAFASPTLLAIACSGVLIGHERQSGSWMWSSSLPVSWHQSLVSKLLVWLGAGACMVAVLLGVAAIVLSINHSSLGLVLFSTNTDAAWAQLMTLFIAIQVFVYFSIATLLIKDTLLAIVIAAFGLFLFHMQVSIISFSSNVVTSTLNYEYFVALAYLISFVIGAIVLAGAYRWRWGVGQFTSFSLFAGAQQRNALAQRAAWQSYAGSASRPSELAMLMHHGVRNSFWLRAIVFCGATTIIYSQFGPYGLREMAAILSSCVLGVSVFSGDQTLNRYRFFADRGVDWKKLLVSHAVVPAFLTLLIVCIAVMFPSPYQASWIYSLCAPIFIVGMFSSLVFPNSIISITIALAMMLVAFAFSAFADLVWQRVAPGNELAFVIWVPVATLLVLTVAVRQVPHWLMQDRFKATGRYFTTMLVAALLPCVLGLSFGFLQIPNVPWQGTPLEKIKAVDWSRGPELRPWDGSIAVDQFGLMQNVNLASAVAGSRLSTSVQHEVHEQFPDFKSWFSSNLGLLEAIENGGEKPTAFEYREMTTLDSMIQGSAVLALMATHERDREQAIRAWKANRKLLEFCQQPGVLPTSLRSVAFVWEIWNTLEDDDLQFLLDMKGVQELMPPPVPTMEQFREVLRARGTLHRIASRSRSVDLSSYYFSFTSRGDFYYPHVFFPPFRWAYERQHALALVEDLAMDYAQDLNVLHDPLTREYTVLSFLEYSFAAKLGRLQKNKSLK